MRPARTPARLTAILFVLGVLLGAPALLVPAPAAARAAAPLTDRSVTVTVTGVTPSTPVAGEKDRTVTVSLSLANTTDQQLDGLTVVGERSDPINSRQALDEAIRSPRPPDPSLVSGLTPVRPVSLSLGPSATAPVRYAVKAGLQATPGNLCICQTAIYPLWFSIHYTGPDGVDTVVGTGQTYVPAFPDPTVPPVRVSWLWPIMDRPHRLADPRTFTDDDLATSVSTGRLDRLLRTVEAVAADIPLTLVVDPEILDELAVMSSGDYRVATGATLTPGTGGPAAASWLARLRAVLDEHPGLELQLTPFADPDVESLVRNGLTWSTGADAAAQTRVTEALGGRTPPTTLAWPANETLSQDTLTEVRAHGATTVVLDDRTLPGGDRSVPLDALAPVQTPQGSTLAAVTSTAIQKLVAPVLSVGGTGPIDLPKLVAQVAVRAAADPTRPHYVVIAPPRDLDPSAFAARALRDTAATSWSRPVTVRDAVRLVAPVDHGPLTSPKDPGPALPPATIDVARQLTEAVPGLASMFVSARDAAAVVGTLPDAVQRAESAAWLTAPALGGQYTAALVKRVAAVTSAVRIVTPSTGTYTLASQNSPLPVTVTNDLSVPVRVRVSVSTVNGLPGFEAEDVGVREIAPRTNVTLKIPVDVQRAGRFQVLARLSTPTRDPLGDPVPLSVRSTALGTIGIVITIAAGAVLVLALLVRLVVRLRRRRKPGPPVVEEELEPVVTP